VRLEPQRMAGIFGIDHASSIFDFQNVTSLPKVAPSVVTVNFALKTGSRRTAILLVILTALLAVAGFLLSRTRTFRIAISNGQPAVAALRPLGSHNIALDDGQLLGRLSRGLTSHAFLPVPSTTRFTVVPANEADTWEIRLAGGSIRRLSIKAEGGRQAKPNPPVPRTRAAPPPPPSSKNLPPPGRPPRIGRL
jgi:hypothetical protein